MSTYVREKVLRLPIGGFQLEDFKKAIVEKLEAMGSPVDDVDDDLHWYTEKAFHDIFGYGDK